MTHILHRDANVILPTAVSGSGIEIVDADGKRYLDASGGAAVSCLGHGHPDVLAAMHEQLDALAYSHTAFFTTEAAERLADRLIEDAPAGLEPRLSGQRRIGGDRGGAQDGAPVFRRDWRARAPSHHRPAAELSRQYARRARGRRQRVAAGAIRAAPDQDPPHRPLLRLSRTARGRERGGLCRAGPPRRSRTRSSKSAPTGSSPSSPKPWSAQPWARSRRPATISSASGRSATAMACC